MINKKISKNDYIYYKIIKTSQDIDKLILIFAISNNLYQVYKNIICYYIFSFLYQ